MFLLSHILFLIKTNSMETEKMCSDAGKAIAAQACTGPEGSRRFRLSDFKTIGILILSPLT